MVAALTQLDDDSGVVSARAVPQRVQGFAVQVLSAVNARLNAVFICVAQNKSIRSIGMIMRRVACSINRGV